MDQLYWGTLSTIASNLIMPAAAVLAIGMVQEITLVQIKKHG